MPNYDKKPSDYDPPNVGPDNGGLQPPDPFHIPGSDWNFNPFLDPNADDPSPYQPKPTDPITPGGTPKPPSWWQDPDPAPVPENPFTPEAQKKIKDKHAAEEAERLRKQQEMQQLEDEAKKAKQNEHDQWGDFPEPSGDTGNA